MVAGVKALAKGWTYEVIAMGYPGPVLNNRPVAEPHNLGRGWEGFDYAGAFGCPVKIANDAAMQALGSYNGGKMLFLGLGTGLGSTMIVDGVVEPMELAHLPYRKATYEDYVGLRGLVKRGKKKWREYVADVVSLLGAALQPDDIVIGGGNAKELKKLPTGCRAGDNSNAFIGGFRLGTMRALANPPRRRKCARRRLIKGALHDHCHSPVDRASGLESARRPRRDDAAAASAPALRRRPQARRAPQAGCRRHLPRLLEASDHRRNRGASRPARGAGGPAGTH
jgi:polyphosphate glucokinase